MSAQSAALPSMQQLARIDRNLRRGRLGQAAEWCRPLLAAWPDHPEILSRAGRLRLAEGHAAEALRLFDHGLSRSPASLDLAKGRAEAQMALGAFSEAAETWQELARRGSVEATASAADCWCQAGALTAARDWLSHSLTNGSTETALVYRYAVVLARLGEIEAAQAHFDALAVRDAKGLRACRSPLIADWGRGEKPDAHRFWLASWAADLSQCNWGGYETRLARLEALLMGGQWAPAPDMAYLGLPLPLSHLARTHLVDGVARRLVEDCSPGERLVAGPRERLHLAFLSPNVGASPTAFNTRRYFSAFDRGRFQVSIYALSADDGSSVRRDLQAGCDYFIEAASWSAERITRHMQEAGVDILIEMGNLLRGGRPEVLAARSAPLQVSWQAFSGSIGKGLADYALVDAFSLTAEESRFWSEARVDLPHSYFACDPWPVVEGWVSRRGCGLPEEGTVFANFNTPWKIDPRSFAVWMRVLKAVPGAVLWLADGGPAMRRNLQREASASGVAASRLIFAPRWPHARHLARLHHIDLVMDTLIFNAHTTALDALLMGAPVLTLRGSAMSARVAAMLLTEAGLGACVCHEEKELEAKAVSLGSDAAARRALRLRLKALRETPLFDVQRRVRAMETAFEAMWVRAVGGLPPTAMRVVEGPQGNMVEVMP